MIIDRQLIVFGKESNAVLGVYLGTHVVNEYIEDTEDMETNGYVSYVTPDGAVFYEMMSQVLIVEGVGDE